MALGGTALALVALTLVGVLPPLSDPPETAGDSFTLAVTGDVLLHTAVVRRAARNGGGLGYDFDPMLAEVAPFLSRADLALCHLEVPLSPDGTRLSSYPSFNAPGEIAFAMARAGYDGCSTASNHSLDQGERGVAATLGVLDAAGLGHAGTARTPEEAGARLYEVGDVTVGHLSYTYGLNGHRVPSSKPWLVGLIDPERILVDAAETRLAEAEVVVVSLHWGWEYRRRPTEEQTRVARRLLESGYVDLLVGHHAHVVQPVERVAGRYVIYGLGNFISNQSSRCCAVGTEDGVILEVRFERREGSWSVQGLEAVPTWVEPGSYRIMPALPSSMEWRAALALSRGRTMGTLRSMGVSVRLAGVGMTRPGGWRIR